MKIEKIMWCASTSLDNNNYNNACMYTLLSFFYFRENKKIMLSKIFNAYD